MKKGKKDISRREHLAQMQQVRDELMNTESEYRKMYDLPKSDVFVVLHN